MNFYAIYKNILFLEHLWTAASQTGTENSVGILARGKEFLARGEKLILKSTHVKSFIYLFIYSTTDNRVEISNPD